MTEKSRLDKYLVTQNLCRSRAQAQELISQGLVEIKRGNTWVALTRPSATIISTVKIRIKDNPLQHYVSRAALKLKAALDVVNIPLQGKLALDVGQSTGGFTQVLLESGVRHVVGIEVGHSQLVAELIEHPQITCLEGINAKHLCQYLSIQINSPRNTKSNPPVKQIDEDSFELGCPIDIVVMDVSFISQTLIIPELSQLLDSGTELLCLVKPQFEVGREGLNKKGIVEDAKWFAIVEEKIVSCYQNSGFSPLAYFPCDLKGGDGNQEFFIHAKVP